MKSTTIKLRVPTEELEQWRTQAGDNLSMWIRARCNGAFTRTLGSEQSSNAATPAAPRQRTKGRKASGGTAPAIVAPGRSVSQMAEVKMAPAAEGRCAHGKRAGEVCYKCDPRFGFPGLL